MTAKMQWLTRKQVMQNTFSLATNHKTSPEFKVQHQIHSSSFNQTLPTKQQPPKNSQAKIYTTYFNTAYTWRGS